LWFLSYVLLTKLYHNSLSYTLVLISGSIIALELAGLKSQGDQRDPNSGGPRTYLALLKCLGLLFEGNNNQLFFTQSGSDLIDGNEPLPILQILLLKHQYPSIYAAGKNVKIDPRMKVKPFLFVLQLLNDKRIGYLTINELKIPIIYGHNHDCLELCIRKILQLREGRNIELIIDSPLDLYTRRRQSPDIHKDLSNEGDIYYIANTCKNYLQAVNLIAVEKENGQERISIAQSAEDIIVPALRSSLVFISLLGDDIKNREEIFQRTFGTWSSKKDTRRLIAPEEHISADVSTIRSRLFEFLGSNIISNYPEEFVSKMVQGFGFNDRTVRSAIEPFLPKSLDLFESTYLELSCGGARTATHFELATRELFDKRLFFDAVHTGQKNGPAAAEGMLMYLQ
ncbi:MAG: hypothetical protein JXB29_02885, partial [Sedimentisphaerales bacterium]|nr:hypothetical protein [Sedimentisphaerales bacterium]